MLCEIELAANYDKITGGLQFNYNDQDQVSIVFYQVFNKGAKCRDINRSFDLLICTISIQLFDEQALKFENEFFRKSES